MSDQPSLQDELDLLLLVCAEAAEIAMAPFRRKPDIRLKGDHSPVTAADLAVDAHVHDAVRRLRPDYGWLSEERRDDGSRARTRRTVVLDPIDGTRAFIAETAEWCVAAAIIEDGRPVAGVLHAPASETVYHAASGLGAFRNGEALVLPQSANGTARTVYAGPGAALRKLSGQVAPFDIHPYVPSLALRLAYVAEGRIDATLIRPDSAWWDTAAADLILEEAGGTLCDLDGLRPDYAAHSVKFGTMLAASPAHLDPLLAVVGNRDLV